MSIPLHILVWQFNVDLESFQSIVINISDRFLRSSKNLHGRVVMVECKSSLR